MGQREGTVRSNRKPSAMVQVRRHGLSDPKTTFNELRPYRERLIHVRWSGEACWIPLGAQDLGVGYENATSYPEEGDIAVVYAPANTWKGQPPFGFFDVGVFYGRGARLLMPMGWIQASVCGRVSSEDLSAVRTACQSIRRRGACRLSFLQAP